MAFQKGQSGNPGGRKRDEKLFRDALMLAIKRAEGDKTMLAYIAEAVVAKAMLGDVPAINLIADRLDGKPHQTAEITHVRARAADLSDDELAGFVAVRGSDGTAEAQEDTPVLN